MMELDDNETEFIEVDLLIDFYIQDYKALRNLRKSNILGRIQDMNKNNKTLEKNVSY